VCAYCGGTFPSRAMSLDHVAPRRGLTAYDRRDNLVLACVPCNGAKRDMPPLAFLLASRARAANLVRYGEHLSPMLVDMARSLAPDSISGNGSAVATGEEIDRWAALMDLDDSESPYRD
jgi:hypothetical protein